MANPQSDRIAVTHDIDYQLAFDLAPIGLVLSRNRTMVNCNRRVCEMFGATREQLIGQSFQILYPSADEYERTGARIAPLLNRDGTYSDDRLMKRLDGRFGGEIFWCHVTGRALNRDAPHEAGIWSFEDLSARRKVATELTAREREIAALLIEGLTSKGVGRRLGISPRTVDVYRARLMRKTGAATTPELVKRLLSGQN